MNKRLLISLSIIGIVAIAAIGGSIAYFNDTETSTGNILVAGTMDLKVDHLWQTYNDAVCNTCDLTLISDPTNMVIAKNDVTFDTPYPAVYVGSSTGYIHPSWTSEEDATLSAANAKWIWESDPTRTEDLTNNAVYTFKKTFEWYGPVITSDLWFGVGSDNSVEVYLNNVLIGQNAGEYGYKKESMLHIPAASITGLIKEGENNLVFKVKNWALAGSTWQSNPAGLIYKFYLSGDCQGSYFKQHCNLWGLKNLEAGDTFFNFDDVKPGDRGINIISLHAYDNDAYACLIVGDVNDNENTAIDPELKAGDSSSDPKGELSNYIKFFMWQDDNDKVYEVGEIILAGPGSSFQAAMDKISLTESNTNYIGLAWCAGTQTLVGDTIKCDGSTMGDITQTDILTATITAYAEQQRNNPDFSCDKVQLPIRN